MPRNDVRSKNFAGEEVKRVDGEVGAAGTVAKVICRRET